MIHEILIIRKGIGKRESVYGKKNVLKGQVVLSGHYHAKNEIDYKNDMTIYFYIINLVLFKWSLYSIINQSSQRFF